VNLQDARCNNKEPQMCCSDVRFHIKNINILPDGDIHVSSVSARNELRLLKPKALFRKA